MQPGDIAPDSTNNLAARSVALVFQLRAIDRRRLKTRLGTLKRGQLAQIKQRVKMLFDL